MGKYILVIGFTSLLFLSGCGIKQTPEQIQAQALLEQQRFELQQEAKEAQHKMDIERIEKEQELYNNPAYVNKQIVNSQQEQADSLKYLENSRQVHDTIEVVGVGLSILSALSN